jgi:hypothetical protein
MIVPSDHKDVLGYWVNVHDLALSLDTDAYAENDVLADRQELANVVGITGGCGLIQSVVLTDYDDNGRAITLIFLDADVSIGTENAAVSISDANAASILGMVEISASDYEDMINNQFAQVLNVGLPFKCADGSKSIYVAAVYRDATGDTYTASGIELKIGILPAL